MQHLVIFYIFYLCRHIVCHFISKCITVKDDYFKNDHTVFSHHCIRTICIAAIEENLCQVVLVV